MSLTILLTNDDGVHAPGIQALKDVLSVHHDVYTVAPMDEKSTTGHSLSLGMPLRVTEIDKKTFAVSGFPADCTYWGLNYLFKKKKPDLILSGINRGPNLGQDIFYSGTVAGSREGAFRGVKAMAVSLNIETFDFTVTKKDFLLAAHFMEKVLEQDLQKEMPLQTVLNFNIPQCPLSKVKGASLATLGHRNYSNEIVKRKDCRGRYYYWIGADYRGYEKTENKTTDCELCHDRYITMTPLTFFYSDKLNKKGIYQRKLNKAFKQMQKDHL